MKERKKWILALSCLVVFFTTYLLILPAFTLDKEDASEQGGIDVPGVEQSAEADGTVEDLEESSSEDIEKEETVEASSEDVEKEEAAKPTSKKSAKSSKTENKKTDAKKKSADITLENDENDDFSVAVESKDAVLSEDMSVTIREIDKSDKKQKEEYESLYSDALEAVQKAQEEEGLEKPSDFAFAKFYDISLMDGDTEVEPESAVDVKISFGKDLQKELKVADSKKVHIVHFVVDKETGEVTPEVLDTESTDITVKNKKVTEAAFTTDSFSVFAVVYTVDFHWNVDGKEYDFSLPGGGFVSLESIVEALKVTDDAKTFVTEVEKAEVSDSNLVWVGKAQKDTTVGELKKDNDLDCQYSTELTEDQIREINSQSVKDGEWALISLKPFDTEESLNVTMKNGDHFVVKVTDAQLSTHVITADGQDYVVNVTYDDAAQIPEDAELKVTEITDADAKFEDYLQKTMAKAGGADVADATGDADVNEESMSDTVPEGKTSIWSMKPVSGAADPSYVRFFDIEIQSEGQKIEPNSDVSVQISLADVPEIAQSDLQVVHFAKDGMELMDVEEGAGETENTSATKLSFVTDEFSVFSIVSTASGTVDDILNKSFVLVCHDVAVSPEQNTTFNYTQNLRGIPVTINGNTISTTEDSLPVWQIHRYWGNGQYYYQISTEVNGVTQYLHIADQDRGRTYVDSTPQNLRVVINDNHTRYRFYRMDSDESLDLFDNNSSHGFGTYNGIRDYEFFTLYELGQEIRPHVTVHFVDRDGNLLENVKYEGENSNFVTKKADGTFEISYNWKGATGNVNLETDFSLAGYTYANAHLAKTSTDSRWTGSNYNQNGLVIDSTFTSTGSRLRYKSYIGHNSYKENSVNGDGVKGLETFYFDDSISTYAVQNGYTAVSLEYAEAGNKDVYVILDPKPESSSGEGSEGGPGGEGGGSQPSEKDPNFKKKLEPNGDGTYTLSLSVTGHAQNNTDYPKANVLLVVDTSSSMVTNKGYTEPTRLAETKIKLQEFTQSLFKLNGDGQDGHAPADTVEVAMFSFDGSTHDLTNQWMKSNSEFNTALSQLNTHKGTNWEDALQKAYTIAKDKKNQDNDPTFVIFFTDGEPSQYTNFHQSESNSSSTSNGWKYFHPYLSRETVNDEARQIVREGLRFYSVFAYGDDTEYNGEACTELLHNLVKYGYDTTDTLKGKNFFDARNATDMTNAFTKILHSISSTLGITDVVMNDSITSLTRVGISNSGSEAKGFKYTRSGGKYGENGQTWTDAPSATYDDTGVHWDLSKDKNNNTLILEDGVTYTVSFTVWPTQQAYDYVTQLNDGFIKLEDIPEPDKSCFKYNEATKKYEVVTNPTSGPDGHGNVVNKTSYTKTESETVTELPSGVEAGKPIVVESGPNDWPKTKTTTTYTINEGDGTWTKTVVTEVIDAFNPPDKNMTLTNSLFNVEKKWQLGNRPEEMIKFLYDITTGKVIGEHKNIYFLINQIDDPTHPVKFAQVKLGYDEDLKDFKWADATQQVTVENITYNVGTVWKEGLDISVGLMLSPDYAEDHNIYIDDPRYIPVYDSEEDASANGEVKYYVLETGHDYLIDEPNLDYRFDFETEVYHPMLVNGQPQNVKVKYQNIGGKTVGIMTGTEEALSKMQGRNILRGELDMKKIVLNPVGEEEPNNTELFDFIVTLENNSEPGPFYNGTRQKVDDQGQPIYEDGEPVMEPDPDEQNIPWYGVHPKDEPDVVYYYHKNEPLENGDIEYVDEKTACIGGNYWNGLKRGYSGNEMVPDNDPALKQNKVSAEIKINAHETWTITNIPGGTTYTIREIPTEGYGFVDATEIGTTNKVQSPADPEISGTVHSSGGKTEVEFRNQRQLKLDILKVDVKDLNETEPDPLPGAAFRLEKYKNSNYRGGLDTSWGTNGQKTATENEEDPGKFRFIGIAPGYYKLVETAYPDGYVGAESDPLFQVVRNDQNNRYEIQLLEINSDGDIVQVENNQSSTIIIDDSDNEIKLLRFGNTPGTELPHSGGIGTTIFYIFGALLTLGSGIMLVARRRTQKN